MKEFFLAVLTILVAIAVYMLYEILGALRALKISLSSLGRSPDGPRSPRATVSATSECDPPVTVWVFRDQRWQVETAPAAPEYLPGPPPTLPGSFAGQRVKTVATRRV